MAVTWILKRTDDRYYAGNGRWLSSEADALEFDSKADAHYTAAHFNASEAETTPPSRAPKRVSVRARRP